MKPVLSSLVLSLALVPAGSDAAAQCGAGGLQVSFSPANPTLGQTITIQVTNVSTNCVYLLPDTCLYKKVYMGQCGGTQVVPFRWCSITQQAIQPGQSFVDTWDQTTHLGAPVGPGQYFFDVTIEQQSGPPVKLCPSVWIESCPTPPVEYGAGSPGTAGFTPGWSIQSLPKPGGPFVLSIDDALGGAGALLAIGAGPAQIPAPFGELLVDPNLPLLWLPFTMAGQPGIGGDGTVTFGFTVPNDQSLVGVTVYLQCLVAAPQSTDGIAHTRGLQISVCPP